MTTSNVIVYLFIGFCLGLYGIWLWFNKKADLGIGRPPVFTIAYRGQAATILAVFIMLASGLFVVPSIVQIFSVQEISEDWFLLHYLALAIISVGLVYSAVIQAAILLGESLREQREKNKVDDHNKDG